jgi:hypothetical protein
MKNRIQKIVNRSGIRECDICHKPLLLEEHHINGRNIPDFNQEFNKCNICPLCHYKVHLKILIIEQWFMSSDGRILLWHKKDDTPITDRESTPHIIKTKE